MYILNLACETQFVPVGLTAVPGTSSPALKVPGQNIIRLARVPIVTFETKVGTAGMVDG